jgi:[methyl-Co(III) methanol-specific corrinoid protein]:coenzyme M methyltransferase
MGTRPGAKENLLAALRGEKPAYRPVISVCQYATYELMDKLGAFWPKAHSDGAEMAALAAGGATVYGFDAVRVPWGQTTEAEALGAVTKDGGKTHFPNIITHPYTPEDTPVFPADFLQKGPVPAVLEAVRRLKAQFGDSVALMGSVCGPFSVAANLLGIAPTLKKAMKKPDSIRPFVDLGLKAGKALAEAYRDAGADIIVIEDMMASMTMISPKIYRDLVFQSEKDLISHINEKVKLPTILHICGRLDAVITEVAGTGATAISVEHAVNIPAARKTLADAGLKAVFAGVIDPMEVLRDGSLEGIEAAVQSAAEQGVDILAPGCAVAPDTPIANVLKMVETARST